MSARLSELSRCFQGVIPALIGTCGADGEPNVTYLSQVHYVDERHVALSCQFFNKTRRNVAENPYATLVVHDPVTMEAWRIVARFQHAETEGPLFESMSLRIDAIASHTGMAGVFRLLSADVYEVLSVEAVEGFLEPPDPALDTPREAALLPGPLTELRGLQVVSSRIAQATGLDEMLERTLTALDELLGFSHAMVLRASADGRRLVTIASRGYGGAGLGACVELGAGLIGAVARERRMLRVSGMDAELRYGRAIRERALECGGRAPAPEVPLPGLCDAQAQLALPLLAGERLVGVLAVESRDPLCFDEWDEAFLGIVANQIALGIERFEESAPAPEDPAPPLRFVLFKNDDCVFLDGDYLVRNVPARILWRLLTAHARTGQLEFTNRELRLDPTLGLPPIKDNLESRLILLRKRLAERCPAVRLPSCGRGRFHLELDRPYELEERESAASC
jgi:hypothetical protein